MGVSVQWTILLLTTVSIGTTVKVMRSSCTPPALTVDQHVADGVYRPRRFIPSSSADRLSFSSGTVLNFSSVQEVQFVGMFGSIDATRVCKIKCVNGEWLGPLCTIYEPNMPASVAGGQEASKAVLNETVSPSVGPNEQLRETNRFQPMLRGCSFDRPTANVLFSYGGRVIPITPSERLAHSTVLGARCKEVGVYKFVGNSTIKCWNGKWDSRIPVCVPTNLLTNLSEGSPPAIKYHVTKGTSSVSDTGSLVILPGSIVHLDCINRRMDGNPYWTWLPKHRQYPLGWVQLDSDRDWKYRLSLYYTQPMDSGTFTCTSAAGKINSINLKVQSVECAPIEPDNDHHLIISMGLRMNDRAEFDCQDGFRMAGKAEVYCLWTGKWSDDPPVCEAVLCSPLTVTDKLVRLLTQNITHRGKAVFGCPISYRLMGPPELYCLNGKWTDDPPECEPIVCDPPMPPINGRVLDSGRYMAGDKVQFLCNEGFVLIGQSDIVCTEFGTWSSSLPNCKSACHRPEVPINGRLVPSKMYYEIDESVTILCNDEFIIHGTQKLQCLTTGWSDATPECRPFKFDFF